MIATQFGKNSTEGSNTYKLTGSSSLNSINLSEVKDTNLVEFVKQPGAVTENEALIELSRRHSGLFFKACNRYAAGLYQFSFSFQDLANDKFLVMFNSAKSFKTEKQTKFSTWFYNNSCWHFQELTRNSFRKKMQKSIKVDYREVFTVQCTPLSDSVKDLSNEVYLKAQQIPCKLTRQIFELKYNPKNNLTFNEISAKLGYTRAHIHNLHKVGVEKLRKEFVRKI